MLIIKEIATRMESCFKAIHLAMANQYHGSETLSIRDGEACFLGEDSYFSQVVGWGFTGSFKQHIEDLTQIESFYQRVHHDRIDIDYCTYAGSALAEFLGERGYLVTEVNNVSVIDLSTYKPREGMQGRIIKEHELANWATQIAIGFDAPEAAEQFNKYITAQGVVAFGVFNEGSLVAGATLAVHDKVGDLGVTSTLPAFRGQGLHKLLLHTRLDYAKSHGVELAMTTTQPGTVSDLNVQKVGFQLAYSRIKFTKDLD